MLLNLKSLNRHSHPHEGEALVIEISDTVARPGTSSGKCLCPP